MKKLNKNQWIAVGTGIVVVTFFLYGASFLNLFTPKTTTSMEAPQTGVQKEDEIVGQGQVASVGDTVTVHYVGELQNGKVFDSSLDRGQPFTFTLGAGQVIRGWDEGLVGMQVGGKRRLTIAPDYAYGSQAVGPIPANSTLIFEVQLLGVVKPAVGGAVAQ